MFNGDILGVGCVGVHGCEWFRSEVRLMNWRCEVSGQGVPDGEYKGMVI